MAADGPTLEADARAGNKFAIAAVEKAPKLQHPLHWIAFNDLSTERTMGGPIPRSVIRSYAEDELELYPDEADAFVWIIRKLDIHHLTKQTAKPKGK